MDDLTPRQIELLKAIINEYTETGEPVGSDILDKKYTLGVSPATIRNDMVELAKKEYMKKEYFSSGRVPTAKAFRFYIKNLMNEKQLSTADEVAFKSDVWDFRHQLHQLLQRATHSLADRTQSLAVATTSDGDVYYCGIQNMLGNREFWDIERARLLLERCDEYKFWQQILQKFEGLDEEMLFMFGDDDPDISQVSLVFGEFESPTMKGAIGVLGPRRMRYDIIVPNVRYFTELIESIVETEKVDA